MPSEQNVQPPFDPTAYTEISGAQLKQLIDGIMMYSDKGIILKTTDDGVIADVPDANTTTEWQRYMWLRIMANGAIPYIWQPTAASSYIDSDGNNLLKWRTLSAAGGGIGIGTITNEMIADNTIQDAKIVALDASKLTGSLPASISETLMETGDAAGGGLTGFYPDPTIAAGAVGASQIVDASITNAKHEAGSQTTGVGADKLKCAAVAYAILRTNAGATAAEWASVDAANVSKLANITGGDSLKILRVNSGETAYEKVAPTGANGIGNVLQSIVKTVGTMSGSTALPFDATVPQNTEGDEAAQITITPQSGSSLIHIHFECSLQNGITPHAGLAFFRSTNASAMVARSTYNVGAPVSIHMDYWVTEIEAGVPVTFSVRFGAASGTTYLNANGATNTYGAANKSFFVVEEIRGGTIS